MGVECESLEKCPFFKRFSHLEEFRIKGFKNFYCHGPMMPQCARIKYKEENGCRPPDELAPTGLPFIPHR